MFICDHVTCTLLTSKIRVMLSCSHSLSAVESFFCQSFILISISILSVTNPYTSHFVSISWCPSDAFHSHSVEIDSSLRYSVSVCVGVWGPVLFSTLFGTSAYGKRSWQLTRYGSFNYSSDQRARLSPNIRHHRHHNQHSHFLPHY